MPSQDFYRGLEADGAATPVAGRKAGRGAASLAVLGGSLVSAGVIFGVAFGSRGPSLGSMTAPDSEEFRTSFYQSPSVDAPEPAKTEERIKMDPPAPPPPSPPPPEAAAAPPAPSGAAAYAGLPVGDMDEDAERRRLEDEERRRWERLRSPMTVIDATVVVADGAAGATARLSEKDEDANRRFLSNAAGAGVDSAQAIRNDRTDALIAQGTVIRGVLETALQSDLPGQVRAVTTEDVWSFDGRRVLIPKGSRLIGDYKSGIARGQTRVFVVWTRMLRADGVSVQLGSIGTDALGRSGLTGDVDNHYVERYGSAAFLSVLGAGGAYLLDNRRSGFGYGGYGSDYDIPGELRDALERKDRELGRRRAAGEQLSRTLTELARDALQDSINIPPTIHVDQGTRIVVFVRRDLDFSTLYPNPVREALREIKRGLAPAPTDGSPRTITQPAPTVVRKP